jgi:hypothetical protein
VWAKKKIPSKKVLVRVIVGTIGGTFGAVILLIAATLLLGPGWHLMHGNYVSYEGWQISVPRGFFVTHNRGAATIWKVLPGQGLLDLPYAQISLHYESEDKPPFSYAKNYDRSGYAVMATIANPGGYKLTGQPMVPAGGTTVYCWELSRSAKQPGSSVWCAMGGSRLYVSYFGSLRYLPDFYGVLKGMTLERAPSR